MATKKLFVVFLFVQLAAMSLAGTIHLTNSKMTLTGTGTIKVDPAENFWAGLAGTRRFPIILSGDLIALKLARSSGTPRWMKCTKSKQCITSTCPGGPVIKSAKFSSCPREVFRIRTLGKTDGQSVESGDYVTLAFPYYAENRYFYCTTYCYTNSALPAQFTWDRKKWFSYNYVKFQIFSGSTDDGKPIQYGDVVGFRNDYVSNRNWLYSDSSKMYSKPCTNGHFHKASCAKINTGFGFQIYKKI